MPYNFRGYNKEERFYIDILCRLDGVSHRRGGGYTCANFQVLQGHHRDYRGWPLQVPHGFGDQHDHPLHEEDEAQRRGHLQDRRE